MASAHHVVVPVVVVVLQTLIVVFQIFIARLDPVRGFLFVCSFLIARIDFPLPQLLLLRPVILLKRMSRVDLVMFVSMVGCKYCERVTQQCCGEQQ